MKYLGVDFGRRKIGLAVSEGDLASPWQIIEVKNFSDAVEKTSQVIKDGGFQKIVVGLPEGKMGKNVIGFVNNIKKIGFDVVTADETLSSKKALQVMIEQGRGRKKRHHEDDFSAAEILQNYLDNIPLVNEFATGITTRK